MENIQLSISFIYLAEQALEFISCHMDWMCPWLGITSRIDCKWSGHQTEWDIKTVKRIWVECDRKWFWLELHVARIYWHTLFLMLKSFPIELRIIPTSNLASVYYYLRRKHFFILCFTFSFFHLRSDIIHVPNTNADTLDFFYSIRIPWTTVN